ncbi:MAG TPA: peroxiredoxin [Candidatus Eisenbacteria bacterium]|nr:peroxiredoxin [Candidatus Eisenbacteria bacterium]
MKRLLLFLLLAATAAAAAQAAPSDSLRVGDQAPDFALPYATRDSISMDGIRLSSLYGKGPIVLAFYPADWSGGCTKEVCSLRDNFTALSSLHAQVLGLSGDYPFSHHEWAVHHNLPFTLVSDHQHEVARKYFSYDEASGFDHRTVYALDPRGRIAYIDLHYSPRDSVSLGRLQAALRTIH